MNCPDCGKEMKERNYGFECENPDCDYGFLIPVDLLNITQRSEVYE